MTSEGGGKLPSVDHGRRTDRGRDKKKEKCHYKLPKYQRKTACIVQCVSISMYELFFIVYIMFDN